jgi:hypothetical protein
VNGYFVDGDKRVHGLEQLRTMLRCDYPQSRNGENRKQNNKRAFLHFGYLPNSAQAERPHPALEGKVTVYNNRNNFVANRTPDGCT